MSTVPVITIDGPSGSGKGTVALALARRLNWHLLDSGALYRAVAIAALEQEVALENDTAVAAIAGALNIKFADSGEAVEVFLNDRCIDTDLRTETTGEAASVVAQHSSVRAALLERQRAFAQPPGLIADGRDMGTVVFPEAVYKFFLTADPLARAERRHKQLKDKGIGVSLRGLAIEIEERDRRDTQRKVSPLHAATDATLIDSTQMSAAEVVDHVMLYLSSAGIEPTLRN